MQSQNAVITGASSGIGKAFAYEIAKRGGNVILVARTEATLTEVAEDIEKNYGVNAYVLALDLGLRNAAETLFDSVKWLGLEVDLLVNNAGFGKWSTFEKIPLQTYRDMIELNVVTLTELCHLYLPIMKERKSGGIINVASTGALIPVPYSAVYAATKSYVLSLSEALSGECKDSGVTVTCLCPSGTVSNFGNVATGGKYQSSGVGYESAERVARVGIEGYLAGKPFVVTGSTKWQASLLPRFLSRSMVIRLTRNAFKRWA